MIIDSIGNLGFYKDIIPKCIEEFISDTDLSALSLGRHELVGGIYVNVMEYKPTDNTKYEAHRKYADLQVIIYGKEKMKAALLPSGLSDCDYNAEGDYILFEKCEKGFSEFEAVPDMFYYYAPQDAHMPSIKIEEGKVKKAVFKIPV